MNGNELDGMLRAAKSDEVPIPETLRARIIADAARPRDVRRPRRFDPAAIWTWIGLPGAAALGLMLGLAEPALVSDPLATFLPTGDTEAIDTVFGGFSWGIVE